MNFDDRRTWWAGLSSALDEHVGPSVRAKVAAASHDTYHDACEMLLSCSDREAVLDAAIKWIQSNTVGAYHGTRLDEADLQSVRANGLIPLDPLSRRARIERALSPHPRWREVKGGLEQCLSKNADGRRGRVYLTLSRRALLEAYPHYLMYGAELDQRVAECLLGKEGLERLRNAGQARVVALEVPGCRALEAAHPYLSVDDLLRDGGLPNIVGQFLLAWSYGLAYPDFNSDPAIGDCGLVFLSTVPSAWIVDIETPTMIPGRSGR